MKRNNDYFPHLPEEEINKLVEEMTDPDLSPLSQNTEEELLLIKVLNRKLREGKIKAEMTNDEKKAIIHNYLNLFRYCEKQFCFRQ